MWYSACCNVFLYFDFEICLALDFPTHFQFLAFSKHEKDIFPTKYESEDLTLVWIGADHPDCGQILDAHLGEEEMPLLLQVEELQAVLVGGKHSKNSFLFHVTC